MSHQQPSLPTTIPVNNNSLHNELTMEQLQQLAQEIRDAHYTQSSTLPIPIEHGEVEDGCDFPLSSPNWPFNQLSIDYSLLGCPEIDVIDGKDITPFLFYKNYVSKNRPVVINGLIDDWPAMKLWTQDSYLLNKIGDTDVTIDYTPDGRADAIICNGNYPILDQFNLIQHSQHLQTNNTNNTNNNNSNNSNNSNNTNLKPLYSTPSGLYSDLFAVPLTRTVKFRDFLPHLSHFPTTVYNHSHKDLELEYLYSLYQSNVTKMNQDNKNNTQLINTFLSTLPPKSLTTSLYDLSCSLLSTSQYIPGIPYCQRQNSSFCDEYHNLHTDVPITGFDWANECFSGDPVAVNIWMGSSFSHTSLHQDWFENIYCVIEGMKQFLLIPPSEVYWLRKKKLPTVRWALLKSIIPISQSNDNNNNNCNNVDKNDKNDINNNNNIILPHHYETKEITLQIDSKGRKFYDIESPQILKCPQQNIHHNVTIDSNSTPNNNQSTQIYRFYVVDRTSGDNSEYYELDDLINEQQQNQQNQQDQQQKQQQQQQQNELSEIDLGHSNRPYLITTNQQLHINPNDPLSTTKTTTTKTTTTESITPESISQPSSIPSNVIIYPLIMVTKGNYITIPCFSSKPSTYNYTSLDNDANHGNNNNDDITNNIPQENNEITTTTSTNDPKQSKLNPAPTTKEDYLEYIYQDLQSTPWIDVDVEVNPINFTPGSTRSKHQLTNSHIMRYVANVKRGQTLYLPRQWYHSVRQKERTISINYWYEMEFDGHFVLHEFMRRIAEKHHIQQENL